MSNFYSNERDILELVALLKEHNIRYAVVSPGSTNISFAQSLLYGPDFEVFSAAHPHNVQRKLQPALIGIMTYCLEAPVLVPI